MGIKLELAGKPVASYRPRELLVALTAVKFVRYSLASVVAVTAGQIAFWTFMVGFGWDGVPANLGSVAVGSIPNYLINRYWTWQQSGRNRLWGEIVPFWAIAFLGVVLSTLAVAYADNQWDSPLANAIAQLSGFGILWVGRFLILDKVMWRVVHSHLDADVEAGTGDVADNPARTNGDGSGTPPMVEAEHDGNGSPPDGAAPVRDPAAEPTT